MWEEEEKAKKELYKTQKKGSKAKADVEMEDEPQAVQKKKKHHSLFNKMNNNYYDYDDEDDYDEEEEEDDYGYQETVFNQQNAFGMNVYNQKARPARKAMFGAGVNLWGQPV